MLKGKLVITATTVALSSFVTASVTLTPKAGFGVGGWASNASFGAATDSTSRSMTYNHATGNVLVLSRNGGGTVYKLDGNTAASTSSTLTGVSGGTFGANQIGATRDGQVFVTNLQGAMSGTAFYKVYRYANEAGLTSAAANVASLNTLAGARLGDDFDVTGSGSNVTMVAGYSNAPAVTGNNGYSIMSWDGTSITGSHVAMGSGPAGQFRLGVTFGTNANQVIGMQGGTGGLVNFSNYTGGTGTIAGTQAPTDGNERPMDYIEFNGRKLLATVEAHASAGVGNAEVRVYEILGTSMTLLATSTTMTGLTIANGNAVGSVAWGASSGNNISLYAMSANNGVQAFNVNVVPEPGSMLALSLGALLVLRRKK
jgi:hypothetical protein